VKLELNRNELKESLDNISVLFFSCDKRLDKIKEKEKDVFYNKLKSENSWMHLHHRETAYEFSHRFFLKFLIYKYPELEKDITKILKEDVVVSFCNLNLFNEVILNSYDFISLSKNDVFGESSYIVKLSIEEMNLILQYSTLSNDFYHIILRIFINKNMIDDYFNKKTLKSIKSPMHIEFIDWFSNYEDEEEKEVDNSPKMNIPMRAIWNPPRGCSN